MPFFGSSGTGFFMLGGGGSTPPPLPALPPVINSPATAGGVIGTPFLPYTITATNSPTSFSANVPPPAGLVFTPPDQITGTPTGPAATTNVTLSATNADGTGTRNLPITITAAPEAPVITAGQTISGTAGSAITPYTVQRTTTGTPPVTWSATGLPANLTINASTGVISGTPTTNTGSPFTANITATNATGSDTKSLTVTVAPAAAAVPSITSSLVYSIGPGGTVNYQITASNPPITSYAASGLPAGVTVNTTTGLISGTAPATVGSTNVTLTATNATGTSAPATLVFTVAAGWTMTHLFGPGGIPTNFTMASNGSIPIASWTGYNATDAADLNDTLYDLTSMAQMPVNLWAKYATDSAFVLVTFDNFGGTPAANSITNWGWNSMTNSVYISGSNSTSQPIQLELRKT